MMEPSINAHSAARARCLCAIAIRARFDLISYRNSGKGCTRALIGSNEP
jgi:hypothetical protein